METSLHNGVRIYDASGADQVNQPRTIHRYFAQGEFAGVYPKPRVGGSVPASWQVDVESIWPDGSVMAAFISLPVSIPANGNVIVDFVSDVNPCHLGNRATCQAAALDQAGMLAFAGGTWDAAISGTANGVTYSASARTILTTGALSYRLRGPYATQVIVEDFTRPDPAFDFGWEYVAGAWQAPSASIYKSVHPLFVATFYSGWSGVEVEAIALNAATTRLQRQVFDLSVTRSGGATVYSKAGWDMPRNTGFSRYFWDGAAPAAVQVDWNLRYMIYSRVLPPFDWRQQRQGSTDIAGYNSSVGGGDPQDCNPGNGSCGNWQQYIPGTGGRGDIGLIPRWYVTYGYAMGDTATYTVAQRKELYDKGVLGNADAGLTIPMLYLEYDNSALRDSPTDGQRYWFDEGHTAPAFGRVPSTYARPEWLSGEREPWDGTDKMVPVCTSGPCSGNRAPDTTYTKGWTIDAAHMPSPFAVPYMLSGRYSYLLGQFGLAAYMAAKESYGCYYYYSRCSDWSLFYLWGNVRASAWSLREVGMAALLAPSARPEKAYFTRILQKNDEMWEGVLGVSGGNAGITTGQNFCRGADLGSASVTHTSSSSTDWNGYLTYKLNGVTKTLGLPDPAYSVTSVTVDSVAKTVGVRGVDSGRDWYYTPGGFAVFQDDAASPVAVGSTVVVAYRKTSVVSPWCSGRHLQMKGQPNNIGHQLWAEQRAYGSFMLDYFLWTKKFIEDTGAFRHSTTGQPLFRFSNAETAKYVIGWATDPGANPHYADYYTSPTIGQSNALPATWAEYMALFPKSSTLAAGVTNSATTLYVNDAHTSAPTPLAEFFVPSLVRIENEWVQICGWTENAPTNQSTLTVCAGGRGMFGTAAVAHSAGAAFDWTRQAWNGNAVGHSYPNLWASAVAMYEEYVLPSGSGRRAWERVMGNLAGQQSRMTAPEYAFVPRDRITAVRVAPGAGALALTWVAPSGAPCKVGVASTAPSSSDDAGDANSTAAGRAHSFSASGLSSGAVYWRITCGTARANGIAMIP
jgi:hypothetical protein